LLRIAALFHQHSIWIDTIPGQRQTTLETVFQGERMLHWIWEAIVGLIVGALAKLIMPGKDPGGIWITMALGVAGSLLATLLGKAIGWYGQGEAAGFFMSLIGAVVLLAIYRFYKSKSTGSALK
jgi:uncharacterized membrane protein YeaQ/YmgE (transglycosylase-associated protein family)